MSYDARYIANLVLMQFDAKEHQISNKKINKLVYMCHGHLLADLGVSVVRNHPEAWTHGPVYPVLYQAFRANKFQPIEGLAVYFDYACGHDVIADPGRIESEVRHLMLNVVQRYIGFSADQLERLTHDPMGPWAQAYESGNSDRLFLRRIREDSMTRYFSSTVIDSRIQ